MISFACKSIEIKDLIKCSFDLNKTDYTLFEFLITHKGEFAVGDINNILKLERSTIQKAIKTLLARDLVIRRQVNFGQGGYQFYYSIKDKEAVKERIIAIIDGWQKKAKDAIKLI
jgi:predicted transcriptional regulator